MRALQAVDEIVDDLVKRLDEAGILDETYIFFSTDNGYHIGQHRLQPGKQCAFEEDVNVPFIVRGPGIARGKTTDIVTSHTDLAPTFLALANGHVRDDFDGSAIPVTQLDSEITAQPWKNEHVNVESWGIIMSEGKHGAVLYPNHTYKALRVIGDGYNLLYTVWCSGEHELYDLTMDPYEASNIHPDATRASKLPPANIVLDSSRPHRADQQVLYTSDVVPSGSTIANSANALSVPKVLHRLDALLMVLKTCRGRECTHPWEMLHPKGDVHDLKDAADPIYDHFYEHEQQRVKFDKCEKGYILESEGPLHIKPYLEGIGG